MPCRLMRQRKSFLLSRRFLLKTSLQRFPQTSAAFPLPMIKMFRPRPSFTVLRTSKMDTLYLSPIPLWIFRQIRKKVSWSATAILSAGILPSDLRSPLKAILLNSTPLTAPCKLLNLITKTVSTPLKPLLKDLKAKFLSFPLIFAPEKLKKNQFFQALSPCLTMGLITV